MIRQAISCDICGTEKKQTNHWFVACEVGAELRLGGWGSRNRLRAGSKHLCGQTCLHKLVDEFMARTLQMRSRTAAPESDDAEDEASVVPPFAAHSVDASLTSRSAHLEVESSARLLTPSASPPTRIPYRAQPELVPTPSRYPVEEPLPASDEPPRYASRSWHAEAWDRERERELRAVERHRELASHRRSTA